MAAETERKNGYTGSRRAIRSPRYAAFLTQMRRWLSTRSWRKGSNGTRKWLDEPAVKLAVRLLTKRHKAVRKLGRDFRKLSARERYQLRIALKKLRYTAEFFRSLYQKKREKAYFRALAQLHNSLGRMNDIVVAGHLLRCLSAAARRDRRNPERLSTAARTVADWYTQSASRSEHQAEVNWREFCHCDAFW
jgi:triphosphatase